MESQFIDHVADALNTVSRALADAAKNISPNGSTPKQIGEALNNSSAGPVAGTLTTLYAVVRIAQPALLEWLASRREQIKKRLNESESDKSQLVTFQSVLRDTHEEILKNERAFSVEREQWHLERLNMQKRIDDLEKKLGDSSPGEKPT